MIRISIIGLGLIGGSIAKALKNSDENFEISAFDNEIVLNKAIDLKVIDKKLDSARESINSSDIIFLALPTNLSLNIFLELSPQLKNGQIISDVSGVKGIFEDKWEKLNSKGFYIGGHPMTGKERGGFENSDPLLFENSLYILSEKSKNFSCINDFTEIIKLLGSRIRFVDPYLHDKIIAYVSHLPQVIAVSLVNSLQQNDDINYLDFAAGGFRDLTRIASSEFEIWEPLFRFNRNEISSSVESLIKKLESVKSYIEKEDMGQMQSEFISSKKRRETIPSNIKGFINPLYDLFIYADDKPGRLFKLTEVLYKNSINIKDIELLKIREGTGGTFRISFETNDAVEKAKKILVDAGFKLA